MNKNKTTKKRVNFIYKSNIYNFLISICVILLMSSCAFIELQKDLDIMDSSGSLHGRIIDKSSTEDSIIIVAYDEDKKIVKYKHLHDNNDYYLFILPAGKKYTLAIFEDTNDNLKYDKGEAAGYWSNPKSLKLSACDNIKFDLTISNKNIIPSTYSTNINNLDETFGDQYIVKTGAIADINNKIFASEYGVKGLWRPLQFLKEEGVGVFFLEKYDPNKIPILFVYGIGGYPQHWKSFFEKIDRNIYQPLFYYYPSGVRIQKAGIALNIIINELHMKYKFDNMFVVAHSMGGLVANEFIKRNISNKENNYIKLFISISTPWAGDKDAMWAKLAPAIIPCWKDLTPQCEFIKNLSPNDLGSIPYYMFFSYHGDRKPFRRNNDDIVYLSSQLKLNMQKKATKLYGFDLNHNQILSNQIVIDTCNAIFAKHTK